MFIVCKILLHGCISRLEKTEGRVVDRVTLHGCISRLEKENIVGQTNPILHGCISRLEKPPHLTAHQVQLHGCISCLETKNKKCSHANKLHGCIRGFRIFLKYLKLLFLYWNIGVFWKFLTVVCVFCLNTYIFWNFFTRFYNLIESCRFLIRRFRTLLISR